MESEVWRFGLIKTEVGQRDLEAENAKLKHAFADMALENNVLKDLIEKSSETGKQSCDNKVSSEYSPLLDSGRLPVYQLDSFGLV